MNQTFAFLIVSYFVATYLIILVDGQDVKEAVVEAARTTNSGLTSTIVLQSHERVLMRRKRFLIFPKGASVICTLSMVKGMVFSGPRGYNMLAEVDYFYPLPDSIEALRPKRKKLKPATTTAAPTPPPPPPPPEHVYDYDHENHLLYNPEFEEHHPDIFQPQSGWRNEPNLAVLRDVVPQPGADVPAELIAGKDRIWSAAQSTFDPKRLFMSRAPPLMNRNWHPGPPAQWTNNQETTQQLRRIDYFPHGRAMKKRSSDWIDKTTAISAGAPPLGSVTGEKTRKSSDWSEHEDWEHFEGHRDRRDLYESLEGMISGINLQPCLLRTICEAQHFLLPKGKSLFHDIFKILFTLPVKDEFTDHYAEATRREEKDCHEIYNQGCPISILSMFLKTERVI